MHKIIHETFEFDLTPYDITIVEDNQWFTGEFYFNYSFPFNFKLTEALNGAGRYYIHTSAKALSIDSENLNSISVYNINNSTLRIIGLQNGGSSLKIFTILGKEVLNQSFTSNGPKEILLPALAKGVYIVQIQNTAGKLNKKIILE